MTRRAAVISIHDVAPPTMEACVELRHMVYEALGDIPVSLLVVPRLHGHRRWDGASAGWLCDRITLGDEPVLHGLYHEDALGRDGREFARGLVPSAGASAVRRGLADLNDIGVLPMGFIAPAYRHPRGLHHALRTSGLPWWCTRLRLHARGAPGRLLPGVGLGRPRRGGGSPARAPCGGACGAAGVRRRAPGSAPGRSEARAAARGAGDAAGVGPRVRAPGVDPRSAPELSRNTRARLPCHS